MLRSGFGRAHNVAAFFTLGEYVKNADFWALPPNISI